jgi:hypothetical protein
MMASEGAPQRPQAFFSKETEFQSPTRISGHWLLPGLASFLVWATFVVMLWLGTISGSDLGFVLGLLGVLGLLASGVTAYLIYALVDRCNRHYSQTQQLFWNVLETFESKPSGPNTMIALRSAEESTAKLVGAENQRSAVLWALLSMIPLVGWVFMVMILWLVSRSLAKHSQFEGPVIEDVDRSFRSSGLQGVTGGTTPIIGRNVLGAIVILATLAELILVPVIGFTGCLAVMFLTLGSLSLLWLDFSISDPLKHFQNQSRIDADIMGLLPNLNRERKGD